MKETNERYWTERYKEERTGWDIGYVSTPMKNIMDSIEDRSARILIPGAGNAYEAEYAWNTGLKNTFVLDISEVPLQNLKERCPSFPDEQLIHADLFSFEGEFDIILEQTFFCSFDPSMREKYVERMSRILNDDGRLTGVLFDFPLTDDGPPFGGSEEEYRALFGKAFDIVRMERCTDSIPPRMGNELFIELTPKTIH